MSTQTAKIQVPLTIELKKQAEAMAEKYGYSSVQEIIRVFLTNLAQGNLKTGFYSETYEILTPAQEKRLYSLVKEAESEETYTLKEGQSIFDLANNVTKK